MATSVHELYADLWGNEDAAFEATIARSLEPRPPEMLYEIFGKTGVTAKDTVLDLGCRDAIHAVELAQRYGCTVIGVDIIPQHIADAQQRIATIGLADKISVQLAGIETLPMPDHTIDHIWCRDVLNHVDLPVGLTQCARVLAPGGRMLVYQTFATDLLEAQEAQRLFASMAIVPANMEPAYFETTAHAAGFTILERDGIDSEWREHWLENGKLWAVEDLLTIARLRRQEQALVTRFGRARYEATYGGCLWGIYQMLGKLRPTIYLLERG
jgi:cyclopropane fatty-acyl-phospholipid synthase-like methyltransferase